MAPKRRCTSCPQQLISLVRFSPQCQLTAAVGIIHRDCSCRPLSPARRSVRTRRRTAGQRPRSTRAAGPAQPNEMIRAIVLEDSLYLPHGLWRRAAHELLALWGTGIKEMTQNAGCTPPLCIPPLWAREASSLRSMQQSWTAAMAMAAVTSVSSPNQAEVLKKAWSRWACSGGRGPCQCISMHEHA